MSFFECCHQCKTPKRHPGCHNECPDYIKQRKLWDTRKEVERQAKQVERERPPIPYALKSTSRKYKY